MKRNAFGPMLVLLAAVLLFGGCQHTMGVTDMDDTPQFAGSWLTRSDALRIASALGRAPDRSPVHWDNDQTGYQYSMTVFRTMDNEPGKRREFSVLSTAPDGTALVLDLRGVSFEPGRWDISAEQMGKVVGKASRLKLAGSRSPRGSVSGDGPFPGFPVIENE
jgi:hypothetical protein